MYIPIALAAGLFFSFLGCNGTRSINPPCHFAKLDIQYLENIFTVKDLAYDLQVAVSPLNGEIILCWTRKENGVSEIFMKKGFPGSFSGETPVSDIDGMRSFNPALASGTDGTFHLAWMDQKIDGKQKEIYAKSFINNKWTKEALLSLADGWTGWDPDIAVSRDGRPMVCWFDHRFGVQHEIMLAKQDKQGWWSEAVRITNDQYWQYSPQIAIDNENTVHLVYVDAREQEGGIGTDHFAEGKNLEIYYRTWDGLSIGPEKRLTKTPLRSIEPRISIDDFNTLHVIWLDEGNEGYYRLYHKDTERFDQSVLISSANAKVGCADVTSLRYRTFCAYTEYSVSNPGINDTNRLVVSEVGINGNDIPRLVVDVKGINHEVGITDDPIRSMIWVAWVQYEPENQNVGKSKVWLCGIKVRET